MPKPIVNKTELLKRLSLFSPDVAQAFRKIEKILRKKRIVPSRGMCRDESNEHKLEYLSACYENDVQIVWGFAATPLPSPKRVYVILKLYFHHGDLLRDDMITVEFQAGRKYWFVDVSYPYEDAAGRKLELAPEPAMLVGKIPGTKFSDKGIESVVKLIADYYVEHAKPLAAPAPLTPPCDPEVLPASVISSGEPAANDNHESTPPPTQQTGS